MGLVDYLDSDSDSASHGENPAPAPAPKPAAGPSKRPFQKLVDRGNPGKIIVSSLPGSSSSSSETQAAPGAAEGDEAPAAKRAKTGGASSRFAGFAASLPAPKARPAATPSLPPPPPPPASDGSWPAAPRPSVSLRTSAEAAFSRREAADDDRPGAATAPAPSIPAGQKAAEDVALVGRPLMFRPLSVARKPGANKKKKAAGGAAAPTKTTAMTTAMTTATTAAGQPPPPTKKKVSLFSLGDVGAAAEAGEEAAPLGEEGAYEPLFETRDEDDVTGPYVAEETPAGYPGSAGPATAAAGAQSLAAIADDLRLSAAERRALLGRDGVLDAHVVNMNMDREYRHNEEVRAAGGDQTKPHNAVRAILPGKHSLRQLVSAVQSQQEALEENFAKNRASQRQSSGHYGWG